MSSVSIYPFSSAKFHNSYGPAFVGAGSPVTVGLSLAVPATEYWTFDLKYIYGILGAGGGQVNIRYVLRSPSGDIYEWDLLTIVGTTAVQRITHDQAIVLNPSVTYSFDMILSSAFLTASVSWDIKATVQKFKGQLI